MSDAWAAIITVTMVVLVLVGGFFKPQIRAVQAKEKSVARQREREHQLARLRKQWHASGRAIQVEPIAAFYKGDATDPNAASYDPGVIGIMNDAVWFTGESSAGFELVFPLDQIRWHADNGTALITEQRGRWHIHQFTFHPSGTWLEALDRAGVTHIPAQIRGPLDVLRLQQDLYGQWGREHTVTLYLLPDRLLVNWRTALYADQICELAVIDTPKGLNLMDRDLLRIIHEANGGTRTTIGFVMDHVSVHLWAEALYEQSGAPKQIIAGRKKKKA